MSCGMTMPRSLRKIVPRLLPMPAWCQQALHRCLSRKVKARDLEKGDLVPRRIRSMKDKKQVDAEVGGPLLGNTSH